nr:hypothetical protein [Rhodococcus qingshengii]
MRRLVLYYSTDPVIVEPDFEASSCDDDIGIRSYSAILRTRSTDPLLDIPVDFMTELLRKPPVLAIHVAGLARLASGRYNPRLLA